MDSPFEVLGLEPGADEAALRTAYRRRVMEAHPDQGGSPAEFRRVRAAYETLRAGDAVGEGSPPRDVADIVDGNGTAPSSGSGRAAPGASASPEETTVEYLDYEVLTANGWPLDDVDVFERAARLDLDHESFGRFLHRSDDSLLQGAENCGFTWPYSCRGGACANCAVAVLEGDLAMPPSHVLTEDLLETGFRLSCVGRPASEELRVVFNVRYRPELDDLLLPDGPFAGEDD